MLKCEVDTLSGQLVSITPELVRVNPNAKLDPKAARLQAQVEEQYHTTLFRGIPLSQKLTYASAAVEHDRTRSKRQTKVGSLVCQSFAAAYRKAAHLDDNALVVGVSHFGSIRAGFPQGDITILSVGEALPFANPLRVYRYTGKQLLDLVEHGYNVCKLGHLQTSGVNPTLDAKGHVKALSLTLPNGKTVPIRANTKLVVVADEFMTTGGDGYLPSQFPASAEIKVNLPTSTDAFIAYLRTLPNID
jgi:putative nucleotidase